MTTPYHHGPDDHGPDELDARLGAALDDAVADIRPSDRLGDLRRRTTTARPRRRRLPIVAAAGVATAVVVALGVVVGGIGLPEDTPAASGPGRGAAAPSEPMAAYFLGDSATGPRLYREFADAPSGSGSAAVLDALEVVAATPDDPDYRTLWPAGAFIDALVSDDRILIDVSAAAQERPAGVSRGEALLGLQQAVYTAEAAIGAALPVAFRVDGAAADRVLGVDVGTLVERDTRFAVTAPVNISDPAEGESVVESLTARGTLGSDLVDETVRWRLTGEDGTAVAHGTADRLQDGVGGATQNVPGWETVPIDVSALRSGSYAFTVWVRGVGQTSDRPARYTDDRTVVVP